MRLPKPDDCRYHIACSKADDSMCPLECGMFAEVPSGLLPPLDAHDPFDTDREDIRTDPEAWDRK